jgi:hypothetical protein
MILVDLLINSVCCNELNVNEATQTARKTVSASTTIVIICRSLGCCKEKKSTYNFISPKTNRISEQISSPKGQ